MSDEPTISQWKCDHEYEDGSSVAILVEPSDDLILITEDNSSNDVVYIRSESQYRQLIKALETAVAQQWPQEADT